MEHPLAGLRILDLSRVVSGPFAGRLLSDLGADVVKLEAPEGDITRLWGEIRHGLSGWYTQQNAGKRNVCVDLKAPGSTDLVLELATVSDVMIENFRPGVLDRLGVGWEVLSAANQKLVLLSISGFGRTGPLAQRTAYAPVIHAESGLLARQSTFDATPATDPMLSIADTNAGLHGLIAVLAALHLRNRTGTGQWIDMAMLDSMLATDDYAHHGLDRVPIRRLGGEVWTEAPGGPIMIAGEFRNTWRVLHTVHDVGDPTPPSAEVDVKIRCRRDAVRAWIASFDDRRSLQTALEKADLAWGDVPQFEDVFAGPHVAERGMAVEVDDRGGGVRRVVQSPYRFSSAPSGLRGPAAYRGEHNGEILAEWLGLPDEKIALLVRSGVLREEARGEPA